MILLSCSNCSYNGLQFGAVGTSAGYCVEHHVVLRRADETTCPRHLRKDLGRDSREKAHAEHRKVFTEDLVQLTRTREPVNGSGAVDDDTSILEEDPVGEAVTNFGFLESKIGSLAALHQITGPRAEVALLSLSRTYLRRCLLKDGKWTSGVHVLWWTRKQVATPPKIAWSDMRIQTAATLERQFELAAWSIVMLRLNFVADLALSAPENDPLSQLGDIVERAAEAAETPSLSALMAWIRDEGVPAFDKALPRERYTALRQELHQDNDAVD